MQLCHVALRAFILLFLLGLVWGALPSQSEDAGLRPREEVAGGVAGGEAVVWGSLTPQRILSMPPDVWHLASRNNVQDIPQECFADRVASSVILRHLRDCSTLSHCCTGLMPTQVEVVPAAAFASMSAKCLADIANTRIIRHVTGPQLAAIRIDVLQRLSAMLLPALEPSVCRFLTATQAVALTTGAANASFCATLPPACAGALATAPDNVLLYVGTQCAGRTPPATWGVIRERVCNDCTLSAIAEFCSGFVQSVHCPGVALPAQAKEGMPAPLLATFPPSLSSGETRVASRRAVPGAPNSGGSMYIGGIASLIVVFCAFVAIILYISRMRNSRVVSGGPPLRGSGYNHIRTAPV